MAAQSESHFTTAAIGTAINSVFINPAVTLDAAWGKETPTQSSGIPPRCLPTTRRKREFNLFFTNRPREFLHKFEIIR